MVVLFLFLALVHKLADQAMKVVCPFLLFYGVSSMLIEP